MKYYIEKELNSTFDKAIERIKSSLPEYGFGVVTEFNLDEKLKDKLGVDFRKYKVIGACNPKSAYEALQLEPMIGTMLPCNIIVQEIEPTKIQVAAIDPVASMQAIENPMLTEAAESIKQMLKKLIDSL
ncbi:MAG: DUF302 domain-containing protein [Salinivirgaceae bacterium]|jgi:uncharacterized protein (DUF302 family)|nr:DUF302 domain-containing protein [Salinivirgaceae bacterium]